ncbi:unnamed protein product [Arctogadus glacialis]
MSRHEIRHKEVGRLSRLRQPGCEDLSEFQTDPQPQRVPVGGAARFECRIRGVPTPVITWEKDGEPVPQETRGPEGPLLDLEMVQHRLTGKGSSSRQAPTG